MSTTPAETPIKKYPQTTAEVAKMLGIHKDADHAVPMASFPVADLPVPGLPIVHGADQSHEAVLSHAPAPTHTETAVYPDHAEIKSVQEQAASQPALARAGKALLPYAAVFFIGIFLYYFFFTKVDFGNMFQAKQVAATPQESVLQQLEAQDSVAYGKWINSYYFDVSDEKIIDPESDNSGNGLTNFQKYLLNLNPKSYDTLGLGQADSVTISKGKNPLTGGQLTDAQKAIVDKYVDMEVVMNRLTLFNLQHPSEVAGASITNNGYIAPAVSGLNIRGNAPASTGDGISQTGAVTAQTMNISSPSPEAGNNVDINTNVPGLLEIPDLKIKVPVIWTQDTNNFETDLQSGVVHYPGTAMPGQIGTTYIAGHSSNYIWAKGSYNQVFSTLGKLGNGTSFKITVTDNSGRKVAFDYVVASSKQYAPTDQAQFANGGKSTVALSTCWPVGSTAKRLVVFGELTQVEN